MSKKCCIDHQKEKLIAGFASNKKMKKRQQRWLKSRTIVISSSHKNNIWRLHCLCSSSNFKWQFL